MIKKKQHLLESCYLKKIISYRITAYYRKKFKEYLLVGPKKKTVRKNMLERRYQSLIDTGICRIASSYDSRGIWFKKIRKQVKRAKKHKTEGVKLPASWLKTAGMARISDYSWKGYGGRDSHLKY